MLTRQGVFALVGSGALRLMVPFIAMLPDILQVPLVRANHLCPRAALPTSATILRRCPSSEVIFPYTIHNARETGEDRCSCIEAFKKGEQATFEEHLLGKPHRPDGVLRGATREPANGPFAKERRYRTLNRNAEDGEHRCVHDTTNFVGVDVLLEGYGLLSQHLEIHIGKSKGVGVVGEEGWDRLDDTVAVARDLVEILAQRGSECLEASKAFFTRAQVADRGRFCEILRSYEGMSSQRLAGLNGGPTTQIEEQVPDYVSVLLLDGDDGVVEIPGDTLLDIELIEWNQSQVHFVRHGDSLEVVRLSDDCRLILNLKTPEAGEPKGVRTSDRRLPLLHTEQTKSNSAPNYSK